MVDNAYLDHLRRSLSCVTTTVLLRRTSGDDPALRRAELVHSPASLRGDRPLAPQFFIIYAVRSEADATDWRIHTLGYGYELYDDEGAELLAYPTIRTVVARSWNPTSTSRTATPPSISRRHTCRQVLSRRKPSSAA